MEHSQNKKIVAPIKTQEGRKPFWMNIGIMGVKNGKVWMRLNAIPTGWDGYAMAVDFEQPKEAASPEQAPLPDTEADGPGF